MLIFLFGDTGRRGGRGPEFSRDSSQKWPESADKQKVAKNIPRFSMIAGIPRLLAGSSFSAHASGKLRQAVVPQWLRHVTRTLRMARSHRHGPGRCQVQ